MLKSLFLNLLLIFCVALAPLLALAVGDVHDDASDPALATGQGLTAAGPAPSGDNSNFCRCKGDTNDTVAHNRNNDREDQSKNGGTTTNAAPVAK